MTILVISPSRMTYKPKHLEFGSVKILFILDTKCPQVHELIIFKIGDWMDSWQLTWKHKDLNSILQDPPSPFFLKNAGHNGPCLQSQCWWRQRQVDLLDSLASLAYLGVSRQWEIPISKATINQGSGWKWEMALRLSSVLHTRSHTTHIHTIHPTIINIYTCV